jgi:hypothetical protein
MILSASLVAVVVAAASFASPDCAYFPGSYFEQQAKSNLQQLAMNYWPGPSQLLRHWQAGGLGDEDKIAILLGASASHDPVLIPIYREAITSNNPRLRMAAAYGYRGLLGDALPNLSQGVDPAAAEALAAEMDAVAATLRARPLVEMWLQAALASEGRNMPGWQGTVLQRPADTCFRAVERVLVFDDFRFVMTAYRSSQEISNRATLLRLLEAVTLQRFFTKPRGGRAGWGLEDLEKALDAGDGFVAYWLDTRCVDDVDLVLRSAFEKMGSSGVDPRSDSSFPVWIELLRKGPPSWRATVARQLWDFGGPWPDLSIFRAESKDDDAVFERLLNWYGLRGVAPASRRPLPR